MKTLAKRISTATIAMLLLGVADLSHRSEAQNATSRHECGCPDDHRQDDHRQAARHSCRWHQVWCLRPHGDFGAQQSVTTEHLFLPWEDVDLETPRVADAYALARGRNLLITVEPWSWDVDWRLTSDELRWKAASRRLRCEYAGNCQDDRPVEKPCHRPLGTGNGRRLRPLFVVRLRSSGIYNRLQAHDGYRAAGGARYETHVVAEGKTRP